MIRYAVLVASVVLAAGPAPAWGRDDAEVKRLKARVVALEAELAVAKQQVQALERANATLVASGGKAPARTLADVLVVGAAVRGDYQFLDGGREAGAWALAVKTRAGNKFTGTYTARGKGDPAGPGVTVDVEGSVDGDKVEFKVAHSTLKATVAGWLKGDDLELTWEGADRRKAALSAKVPK